MKKPKKEREKRNFGVSSFQSETGAVQEILLRAKKQGHGELSRMVNEAIRLHGDEAMLNLLQRDVEIAQLRLKAAQEAFEKRKLS